ncbi:anti-phage deoxyguanosine triphosphatase [Pseudovibrio exalbescens]|uniref:anti-phage deoxyguanosine triphosphatase n=1 Tax=Pseudovibrio exalbescens TaxID=197461 RepID=UPI002366DD18|nr:anti-phage deoxyguanosine triphosphatase [Pseudovibrio exalbescens]MDD7909411.1 anti-phage deoxyguanosine triphosphatase [Pseudovibrio exalbescens]
MNSSWTERKSGKQKRVDDPRDPFDIDYSRIVHSASFRRLQGKTQILNLGDSDFYRTRLTHSMEVAQIAGGLVKQLRGLLSNAQHPAADWLPAENLVQTLGLAHDLGHPPFGHGGEVALNYCMRANGGFEGNGHSLRILSKLEAFSPENGADLTRRVALGLLKYPVSFSAASNSDVKPRLHANTTAVQLIDHKACVPPKAYMDTEQDVVDWLLAPFSTTDREAFVEVQPRAGKHGKAKHKSFDCSIMDVADDIAYGVHDLEDAIALGLITEDQFRNHIRDDTCTTFLDEQAERYSDKIGNNAFEKMVEGLFGDGSRRKMYISLLVHHFISNIELKQLDAFEHPLLKYRVKLKDQPNEFLSALQKLVADFVIFTPRVQHLEFKGQKMVVSVFEVFASDPKSFLPEDAYAKWTQADNDPRVICDYIAGMTDNFLLKTYDRLFSPRMGSIFDRL